MRWLPQSLGLSEQPDSAGSEASAISTKARRAHLTAGIRNMRRGSLRLMVGSIVSNRLQRVPRGWQLNQACIVLPMFAVSPTSPPHRTVITRRLASTFGVALIVLATLSCSKSEAADTYRVRLDPSARAEPATGRIVLFFITETR